MPGEEEDFWNRAEAMVLTALEDYAEHAQGTEAARRRMFAADAARGFALIDLCRRTYDTCLMNPPFGAGASSTKSYLNSRYSSSKSDLYAMFVDRALEITPSGMVGAITNRTGFFLDTLTDWRTTLLTGSRPLHTYADLGDRVLDALVEAAAYTIQSPHGTSPTVFFRLLNSDDKAHDLDRSIPAFINGKPLSTTYYHPGHSFGIFPATRMSYWTPAPVRRWFESLPSLHSRSVNVQFGLSTKDDFRFLRLAWEVSSDSISTDRHACCNARPWMFLAKGGEYSPYFGDIHLVANWADDARELAAAIAHKYPYLANSVSWVLHPEVPYGSPGLTYTRRTTSGFSPRILPSGCLISDTGATLYPQDGICIARVQAISMSRVFGYLLELAVAAGDSVHAGSAARTYEIGIVAAMPSPEPSHVPEATAGQIRAIWQALFVLESQRETSRYFISPLAGNACDAVSIRDIARFVAQRRYALLLAALENASASDVAVSALYEVDDETNALIANEFGPDVCAYTHPATTDQELIRTIWRKRISDIQQIIAERRGFARFVTKQTYWIDQKLELVCHATESHPRTVVDALDDDDLLGDVLPEVACSVVSCCVGIAMMRWQMSTFAGRAEEPEFDPTRTIPTVPPAALSESGVNLIGHENPDGILVDDDASREDVTGYVRRVLETVWPNAYEAIESDLVATLGGGTLQSYLNSQNRFFADHMRMYSKSRRYAPVYWPLSTPSGSYTLWLYYHRLTDQTLYTCVNDFVDHPQHGKLKQVSDEASRLRSKSNRSSAEEKELERLSDLELELKDFRDELLRIAKFWKPNLNDGVQITAAPLWKLFLHKPWQNRLKETWEKLEAGEYDWAHLALSIWPDRVVRASQKDRSYAIAHNLEDQLWHEVEIQKKTKGGKVKTSIEWQPRNLSDTELNQIIEEVKAR